MDRTLYDVIVVGGGPAGLTAALYLARARYRVLVIEKEHFGGQITITADVVNYPGTGHISGKELTEQMRRQAEAFGAEFLLAEVEKLELDGDIKAVHTSRGTLSCFAVLLATGAHPRKIGFAGEAEFQGHGVAYCATCDGEFFTGKEVFVVGGGFAAAEEAVFLTKYAKHITILVRGADFTCAKSAADAARANEKITVLTNVEVQQVTGDSALREIRWKDRLTGEVTVYQAEPNDTFGVFVFAGYEPATDLVRELADLDDHGYVITDRNQKTSLDGLYAAGDVCLKQLRQVVTATADGAIAATELERYAAAMQEKTGRKPEAPKAAPVQNAPKQAAPASESALFSDDVLAQLQPVFDRMASNLILKLYLDSRPVSQELKAYMEALAGLTEKLSVEIHEAAEADQAPCVRVCRADGNWSGLAFHGVPGGHEFTSFVLGLYNAAGPGQAIEADVKDRIAALSGPVSLRILVSLSCTMCPELVTAAQRIAAESPQVTAEVYDLNHYPELRDKYNVLSVPCMVIGDSKVTFGRKNIRQVLDLIG